jgi:hypothetical protein
MIRSRMARCARTRSASQPGSSTSQVSSTRWLYPGARRLVTDSTASIRSMSQPGPIAVPMRYPLRDSVLEGPITVAHRVRMSGSALRCVNASPLKTWRQYS